MLRLGGDLEHNAPFGYVGLDHAQVDRIVPLVVFLEPVRIPHPTVRHGHEALNVVAQVNDNTLLLHTDDLTCDL